MPQVRITSIRPGVTDVRTVGQFEAITDHSRMIDDGRHSNYAIQYTAPIGPELHHIGSERHQQVKHWDASPCHCFDAPTGEDRPSAARYYRVVASTALDRMRNKGETQAEAIAMAAALTDTAPYVGIDGVNELTADEISVIRAILLAIA